MWEGIMKQMESKMPPETTPLSADKITLLEEKILETERYGDSCEVNKDLIYQDVKEAIQNADEEFKIRIWKKLNEFDPKRENIMLGVFLGHIQQEHTLINKEVFGFDELKK